MFQQPMLVAQCVSDVGNSTRHEHNNAQLHELGDISHISPALHLGELQRILLAQCKMSGGGRQAVRGMDHSCESHVQQTQNGI